MNLDATRQSLSVTLVSFVALFALFVARCQLAPAPIEAVPPTAMPLGALIDRMTAAWPDLLRLAAAFCLIFLNAFTLTRTVTRNMILGQRTYLPALIYLMIACGFYFPLDSLDIYIAGYLLIRGCELLIAGFRRQESFNVLFTGSFCIGIAPLLYAPATLYALLVPVAISVFRRNAREAVAAVAGLVLPVLLCSYVVWGAGQPAGEVASLLWQELSVPSAVPVFIPAIGIPRIIFAALVILATCLSLGSFFAARAVMRTRPVRAYMLFCWMLLLSAATFLVPGRTVLTYGLAAIPLAVIIPTFLVRHEGWMPELLFFLLTAGIVAVNLFPLLR